MTKCFCDRCGKECETLDDIQIPTKKTEYGFEKSVAEVCCDCKKEYDDIIDELIDIRFILFRKFMKGGE